jgi:hypothetical protein
MNVVLEHVKKKSGKSSARSTYSGVANLKVTRGRYFIKIRPVARNGGSLSGVEGETNLEPSSMKTNYVCSFKKGVFKTCNNPKKKRAIKIKNYKNIRVVLDE